MHRIAGAGPLGRLAVDHQGQHAAGLLQPFVAPEGCGLQAGGQLFDRALQGEIEAHRRRLGPLALGLHRRFKAGHIHRQALLFGDLFGELQRKAVGVVELKGLVAGNLPGFGGQHVGQQLFAPLQGVQEAGLLPFQFRQDLAATLHQPGMHRPHQGDAGLPHGGEEGPVDAQQPAVAHHPPQQAPQDVAAAEVAGGNAIADQLGNGAAVVADHLQGGLALGIQLEIVDAGQAGGGFDQRIDQIGFVVVGNALQDLGHAFEAHAGVDVATGQGRELALGVAVVLHEHQVVELDEAAVVLQIDARIAQFRLEVVVDLRAGSAGTGGPRGPEVIGFIHANDPPWIYAHQIAPDGGGLVVFSEHAHHQLLGREAKHLGAQLPGPLDRLFFEVIAKGKVAEHLEERVMPGRAAHVLDVVGADALLATGGPGRRPFGLAQEHRLEGQHAGDGEQHRGVVGNQRGAGHGPVAAPLVEIEEGATNLVAAAGRPGGGDGHGAGGGHDSAQ